jgi:nucleotide sugar dehydrogenase
MKDMRVCVVGLGKIGLPLAAQYASKGLSVAGCDPDAELVSEVSRGRCPHVGERGLAPSIRRGVETGRLKATTDTASAVRQAQVVVVIVPVGLTPDRHPDFSLLDEAAAAVARGLAADTLVILETTVPVGTTRGRLGPALEASGLRMGADFRLAYSPERVSVGRIFRDLRRYPKIVGGIDEASRDAAVAFYRRALDAEVIMVRDAETAEFVKLAETTYRDVNIALANELAVYADRLGLDATEAFDAANSQPYSHLHQPGVGVGGHCIPVNPHLLMAEGSPLRVSAAARQTNDEMAAYGVDKLEKALGGLRGLTVLILGLAYRPNVKEAAGSTTFALARALEARGTLALVHDPLFSAGEVEALGLQPAQPFPPRTVDAVVIQALHDQYGDLDLSAFTGCRAVLDGRNALLRSDVEAKGMIYLGIGR